MIYLGANKWILLDSIIVIETDKKFICGDAKYDEKYILNTQQIPGILKTNGAVIGLVKKGTVLRIFVPDYPLPQFIVTSKQTSKIINSYYTIKRLYFDEKQDINIGEITNMIGQIGDIESEKKYLELKYDIIYKNIICDTKIDLTPNRIFITHNIYSIDPPNCYDIDDAIHCIKINNGYEIGVHIADVSSFIESSAQLDKIIFNRTSSVYLPYKQIDMLPKDLIKECSLLEHNTKRAFSVIIQLDSNFQITNIKFIKTFIKVKNMSYDICNNIIKNKQDKDYENLKLIYDIGEKIGNPVSDFHDVVENYMILVNKIVAQEIVKNNKQCILRKFKLNLNMNLNKDLNETKKNIINNFNVEKALYSPTESHDLLGLYTHFTSPMRRYVDIIIHRILNNIISNSNNNICPENITFNELIEKINYRTLQINYASRDAIRLLESYKRYNNKQEVEQAEGFIVKINRESVTVYCEHYNITVNCKLISPKINKLINIVNRTDTNITLEIDNKITDYYLGQNVVINIISIINAEQLKNKLIGEIIEL